MATGLQGSENSNVNRIVLIEGATTANTLAATGVTLADEPTPSQFFDLRSYRTLYGSIPDEGLIVIRSTAGSAAMTLGACRVMVAHSGGFAGPLGVGADATKGMLNNGSGFAEDATDYLYHREVIAGLSMIDGIQVKLGAFGGTATAVNVELHIPLYRREA